MIVIVIVANSHRNQSTRHPHSLQSHPCKTLLIWALIGASLRQQAKKSIIVKNVKNICFSPKLLPLLFVPRSRKKSWEWEEECKERGTSKRLSFNSSTEWSDTTLETTGTNCSFANETVGKIVIVVRRLSRTSAFLRSTVWEEVATLRDALRTTHKLFYISVKLINS